MKCNYNENDFVLYYYDELGLPERKAFEAHLKDCKRCASSIKKLKASLDSVNMPESELTADSSGQFRRKVYEKIEERSSRNSFILFRPGMVQTSALALLLLVTVIGGVRYYDARAERKFIMENYDLMMEIELFEDLEILEYLDEIEEV